MPSATMSLLNKSKVKPKDATDEEMSAAPDTEATEAEEQAEEAELEVEEGADEPDVESDLDEDETAAEQEAQHDTASIPTTKTEVHALKASDVGPVHDAMGSPISGFDDLDLKGKKQALMDHLFPKGKVAKTGTTDDQLAQISSEIENMKTRSDIEKELAKIAETEGENFFRRGGLLVKLSEIGDYGEYANFADYVKGEGIAPEYRTARYWMSIYTGLLEADIPYSQVQGVGWTKIVAIIPVINKENVDDWVSKAKALNVPTLKAEVKAALEAKDGGATSGSSTGGGGDIKSMVFKLHPDQTDTVNDAIAKAKKNSNTESKEVALDHICIEYLGNAPSKPAAKAEAPAQSAGYDPDTLDVEAFFKAIKAKYPDQKEAMAFLYSGPDDGTDRSYFEIEWPEVKVEIDVP